MPPVPKFFDASKPDLGFLDGFEINIESNVDPLVNRILSEAGMIGGTAKIVAALPKTYTFSVTKLVPIEVVKHSTTSSLGGTKVLGTKVIYKSVSQTVTTKIAGSGKLIAGLTNPVTAVVVLVVALGLIQKQIDEKRKQRDLSKQRNAVNKLNKQIEQLNIQEKELQKRLESQVENTEESLSKKVLESRINLNSRKSSITYVVKAGDTLSQIAKNFGVSLQSIVQNNSLRSSNADLIYPGERIIIPANMSIHSQKLFSNNALSSKAIDSNIEYQYLWSNPNSDLPKLIPISNSNSEYDDPFSEVEIIEYYSVAQRIELIKQFLDVKWHEGQKEDEIIELIRNTPQADLKDFFDKLTSSGLLPVLESAMNLGDYSEYHRVLYQKWLEKWSPVGLGILLEKVISSLDSKLTVKEATEKNIFYWKNPAILREYLEGTQRVYYSNFFNSKGDIYTVQHYSPGGIMMIGGWNKISKELAPFDPIIVNFKSTPESFDASKHQILLMPAISLEALNQEQINDDIYTGLNLASLVFPFIISANASRVGLALVTILNLGNTIIDTYRNVIAESEEGRKFLHYFDAMNIMLALHDVSSVIKSSPKLIQGFKRWANLAKNRGLEKIADVNKRKKLIKAIEEFNRSIDETVISPDRYFGDDLFSDAVFYIKELKKADVLLDVGDATDKELAAFFRYTMEGNYANYPMRRQLYLSSDLLAEDLREMINLLKNAHQKLSKTERLISGQDVYRGRTYSAEEFKSLFKSDTPEIPLEGFVSTSLDRNVANQFTTYSGKHIKGDKVKVIMKIHAKNGVFIDDISYWGKHFRNIHPNDIPQKEVLLLEGYYKKLYVPDTPFKIDADGIPWYEIELLELQKPLR
ncbi:hypothetical protein CEQ90_19560 [Lewinellaceae bacterium SD302]|nr:hypothetical protein CEQ90_19560 [Lewinellaceae bacterium SD302]